ncbi:selective LIM binding factor [Tritrichomonas foetus]|uniref:Selective LIM binding factor n=1 Tax=Tritrichomonas foetus TaxID=1144522 RepID=A0A1J4L5Z5_9EUKA|nr:selective LIM binding factor [Tritrichomonas foetus]|eukprot:OHT17436.1 selective LIM binding factor [Tritrichomonas foetus]
MKFDVQPPLIEASNTPDKRVVCVAWAPDGERLAVATTGRLITLFRANGGESSRIPVKARDENENRNFTITGLAWAPDSCRFAVAQSDMAVAVYDIGPASSADSRKKITLRFSHKSSVLCVSWPVNSTSDFVYGLSDGSVMCGLTKMKKTEELYRHQAAPLSIAPAGRINAVAVGHLDGNIFMVNLDTRSRLIALQTAVPPQALAWGSQIVAAGSDLQINFADSNGSSSSHVDFSNQTDLRAFTSATFDPSGSTALVAGRNALLTFNYSPRTQSWTQQGKIEFDGLYSVPNLSWSPDGSKIAVASVTGAVFIVTASIGSFRYKNLFEVVHVTGSQIKVRSLKSKKELSLRSDYRILTTNFQHDRYVISRTTQSFCVGDTKSGKTTEFAASLCDGEPKITERFIFIDDIAVLVWNTGELTVVELGKPTPLAAISTTYASPYLLSLRFNAKIGRGNAKILSYLVDAKTIRIVDIDNLMTIGTIQIPNKVDWLELNVSGTMLLFRDSKRSLYLYNLETKENSGLLTSCSYAQWVPEANVIVAQSKKALHVWYSPTSPDEVRVHEIDGDVTDITRSGTKTSVTISQNGKNIKFPLDGSFIAFSAAMEAKKLKKATTILSQMEMTIDLKSLWAELAEAALRDHEYLIAEVGYANLGDLSRARFLHKLNKLIEKYGLNHCLVQSHIAMLQSNFKQAEYCLIEHDQLDTAIDMYKSMHMWNELLDLAELRAPNRAAQLREEYYAHLVETGQYQVAARLKARRGELSEAIDLCLQGNKPQLAAEILLNNSENPNPQLLTHVAEALVKNNRYDVAGQIYEKLGRADDALDAYRKGHAFYKALELSKAANPDAVVTIEREWADYLVSQGQNDAATNHYVESGDYSLALNCSLRAQQWQQAAEILRNVATSPSLRDDLKLQYLRVGRHFASINDAATAEDLFLTVDAHAELIEMYLTMGRIDDSLRHAKRQMKSSDMEKLFIKIAKKNEKKPATRSIAEKIYLAIKKPDLAIEMYNNAKDSESVVRLTAQYGGDKSQLATMAAQAEREGNLAAAENCYIRAGQWEKALFMYRQEKKWQDAMRIAKSHGTPTAELQVAIHWAKDIGGVAGIQKLQQLNLVEQSLLYCCENGITDFASLIMDNCKNLSRTTLQQAHMKFGCALEAQNRFAEAEQHYITAEQPREAVEMYTHNKMWQDAQRVASKYGITDIPVFPPKGNNNSTMNSTQSGNLSGLKKAMRFEENRQYDDAITTYLSLTAQDCGGEDRFDQVLERAVKLAANYKQNRLQEVVTAVAQILISINRHASLGKILENIEAFADAFEIYKLANMWEDAQRLSGYLEPEEQKQFQKDYKAYLASKSDTNGLMEMGQVDAALQVYAKKGDWDTCLKNAQKEGEQYVEKYTMLYAQSLVDKKKYDEAVSVLAKYSPSSSSQNIQAYIALCQSTVYAVPSYDVIQPSFFSLKQMLFKVLRGAQPTAKGFQQLQRFTRAVHLLCQISELSKYNLTELAARAAQAVLRYCDVLPADFLFFKAGDYLKQLKRPEAAIIFFNALIDISDVIKSGDISNSGQIDHTSFDETDIPRTFCLRKTLSVSEDTISKINDWVLEQTISSSIEAQLPMQPCSKCGRQIYSANMSCQYCKTKFDFCHITGFPVINPTKCTACGAVANRADWGMFVNKTGRCPCCDAPQTAGA